MDNIVIFSLSAFMQSEMSLQYLIWSLYFNVFNFVFATASVNSKFTSSVYLLCFGRIFLTLYSTYIERKNNSELKVESDFITQYSSCMSLCDINTSF